MDRTRIRNEDWARVRFGAGTPWRRCWCVITPPDEKDVQKQQKQLRKKSAYDRSPPALKGNIKFYDTKKTKKARPIATINDAYSAYAIYPQSKPLIEQSTLIKIEGSITIHATPETTTEGLVFVMPEVHPAISGFEMLLRFLFPLYDVFALYGRPSRLIADTIDPRSLMFALPQEKRYGYLEILDIATLVHEAGSSSWSEREWRKRLKDLTSSRMTRMAASGSRSRASSYRGYRSSIASRGSVIRYEDGASIKSTPSLHKQLHEAIAPIPPPHRTDSAPVLAESGPFAAPLRPKAHHQRSFSENSSPITPRHNRSLRNVPEKDYTPSRLSHDRSRPSYDAASQEPNGYHAPPPRMSYEHPPLPRTSFEQPPLPRTSYDQPLPELPSGRPPPPPSHGIPVGIAANPIPQKYVPEVSTPNSFSSSEGDRSFGDANGTTPPDVRQDLSPVPPPASVIAPPAFAHEPGAQPRKRPGISPDLRRANSRLSVTTLSQLADAGRSSSVGGESTGAAAAGAAAAWRSNSRSSDDQGQRGVMNTASRSRNNADRSISAEGMAINTTGIAATQTRGLDNTSATLSSSDAQPIPYYKDKPLMSEYDLLTPGDTPIRNVSPLSQISNIEDDQKLDQANHMPQNSVPISPSPPKTPLGTTKPQPPLTDSQKRPTPSRSSTSHSISRKPVPSRTPPRTSPQRKAQPPTPKSRSSIEDFQMQYVDEEALAQILKRQHTHSLTSQSQKNMSDDRSSMYENDSNVSPDYASTAPRKSNETRRSERSIERPRRGILKTVGTVAPEPEKDVQVGDFTYKPGTKAEPEITTDIPTVNFGPTQAFNPATSSRPETSGTMTQAKQERSNTPERMTPSPSAGDRLSKLRMSPAHSPNHLEDSVERPKSRNLITPEPHNRSGSGSSDGDNRRSMAWQPGVSIGGVSPGGKQGLTAEQFVQQRAAANRVTPVYAHGYKKSASPTASPASRQASGEVGGYQRHTPSPKPVQKRHSSYGNELPARPNSRAASNLVNSPGDYSAHLSAREQEHVARATGSPLIKMASNPNKTNVQQGSGLVGAIQAREQEKRNMKEGVSGQMVQNAIAQRQQLEQRSHQARQASYSTPTPQYAMPGGYPPSPVHQYPPSPAANAPSQPYGWPMQQQPFHQPQQQQQYMQYQQYQQPQPQYQQPPQMQRQWTPPSAGTIYGGHQSQHQQQQQQQVPYHQQNMWQPHQQNQQPQQGFYGPYYGQGGR